MIFYKIKPNKERKKNTHTFTQIDFSSKSIHQTILLVNEVKNIDNFIDKLVV